MPFSSDFFYSVTLVFLISCSALTSSQDQDDDCPFTDGSCPVTLDNVVDVFFHDIADRRSCQRECQQIGDCKFFTMFGVSDSPTDHMKCFLFRKCDSLEPCIDIECTTGILFYSVLGHFLRPFGRLLKGTIWSPCLNISSFFRLFFQFRTRLPTD